MKRMGCFSYIAWWRCFFVLLCLGLAWPASGSDITLRWDPSPVPEVSGYKIYYKKDSPGPPYNGCEALEGHSPIQVDALDVTMGSICEFTCRNLDEGGSYFFAVSAYDTEGNESKLSNEACFNCTSPYECHLVPDGTFIPLGGTLRFRADLTNHTNGWPEVWFGTKVSRPDGSRTGYLWGPLRITLNPGGTLSGGKSHRIPQSLVPGIYTYHGYLADALGTIVHECHFHFEVFEH